MTQFATDLFGGTEGAELTAYNAAWVHHTVLTGNLEIASGRLRASSTTSGCYLYNVAPASADYSVSADLYFASINTNVARVCARIQSSSVNTMYFAQHANSDQNLQLFKVVAGTITQLGANVAKSAATGSTHNIRLEVIGSAIKVYWDGSATPSISVTDTAITAKGYAGIRFASGIAPTDSIGIHVDNFSADQTVGGATAQLIITTDGSAFSGSSQVAPISGFALAADDSIFAGSSGVGSYSEFSLTTDDSVFAGLAVSSPVAGFSIAMEESVFSGSSFSSSFALLDNFERSSVNLTGSTIIGSGDSAVITIRPRVQESEVVSSQTRWLHPVAKMSGANSFRPTFRFSQYYPDAVDGYHYTSWDAGRKPMFSYDLETWFYFDTTSVNTGYIEFRHNTAFTSDVVYISKGRTVSVTQTGEWLDGLAIAHPGLIQPAASALAFTPTLASWPAQAFIADEFSAQTNELGAAIPGTPFYAAKISDSSLTPPVGEKQAIVLISGVHAGEDQGNKTLHAAVEFLLSADLQAQNVRRYFDVHLYPMINAPGRTGGGWRGSFTQGAGGIDDANRHFSDATPALEIITKPRTVMLSDLPVKVAVAIDFHGAIHDKYGFFADTGNTYHTKFDTALETYIGAGQCIDEGDLPAGCTAVWFLNTFGTKYNISTETGDPTPITDADLISWGAAHIKALSDLQVAGDLAVDASCSLSITTDASVFSGSAHVSPIAGFALSTEDAIFAGSSGVGASTSLSITTADSVFSGSASVSPIAGFALATDASVFAGESFSSPIAGFALATEDSIFDGSSGVGTYSGLALTTDDSVFSGSAESSPIAGFSLQSESAVFAGSTAGFIAPSTLTLTQADIDAIATAIGSRTVEGAMSQDAMTRVILAALAGRTEGIGTLTEKYKSADSTKDRITVTFDALSNRTTIVLDGS